MSDNGWFTFNRDQPLGPLSRAPREFARGLSTPIEGVLGLIGASGAASAIGDAANYTLGTSNARWDTDPAAAAFQTLGGAAIGVPAAVPRAIATAVPALGRLAASAPVTTRVLEAVTPVTMPLSTANIARNFVGGTAAGVVLEDTVDALTANAPERHLTDWIMPQGNAQTAIAGPAPAAPALPSLVSSAQAAPVPAGSNDWIMPQQSTASDKALSAQVRTPQGDDWIMPGDSVDQLPQQAEQPPLTLGERIAGWLPYAAVGAGAVAAGIGARQHYQRTAARDALAGTVVQPGTPHDPDMKVPNAALLGVNAVFDRGAIVRSEVDNAEKAGFITPQAAMSLRASVDVGTNRTARTGQAQEVARSGYLPDGRRLPKSMAQWTDELNAVKNADPDAYAKVQEAMTLQNEAANRRRAADDQKYSDISGATQPNAPLHPVMQQNAQTGLWTPEYYMDRATGTMTPRMAPEPARVGLHDLHTNDLHNKLHQLMADPTVRTWVKDGADRAEHWRRFLVRHGMLEQREANLMASRNPFYLPTLDYDDVQGKHLNRRVIEEGAAPKYGQDVMQSWQDYENTAVSAVLHNNAKRDIARFLESWQTQQGSGRNTKIVGRVLPVGDKDIIAPDTFTFRDGGKRLKIETYIPEIASVMRNDPKAVVSYLNGSRQAMQYFTTGPGGAVLGNPYQMATAAFNLGTGIATRPKGTAFGLIDYGAQKLGLSGMRGDITAAALLPYAAAADMAALASREAARIARRWQSPRLADWLSNQYTNSVLHITNRLGAVNTGAGYGGDFATRNMADLGQHSPGYNATRGVVSPVPSITDPRALRDYAEHQIKTLTPGPMRKGWQLFGEALDIVSNTPQSAYFRMNRGHVQQQFASTGHSSDMADRALARATRQLGADPSISGSDRGVQMTASTIPYGNIWLQSLNTYGKAFRENFVGTTLGITVMTAQLALLRAYLTQLYDDDRLAKGQEPAAVYESILGNPQQIASGMRMPIPGLPLDQSPRLPIDPALGPVQHVMNQFVDNMFGLRQDKYFPEHLRVDPDALRSMVERGDMEVLKESANRGFTQFSPPPLVDAALRAGGVDVSNYFSLGGRVQDTRFRHSRGEMTGRREGDPIPDTIAGIGEALGGAGATTVLNMLGNAIIVGREYGLSKGVAAGANVLAQSYEDRLSIAPALWGNREEKYSGYDVNAASNSDVQSKLSDLQRIQGNIARAGTIGTGTSVQEAQTGRGRPEFNPDMISPMQQLMQLKKDIQPLRDRIAAFKDEVTGLNSAPARLLNVDQQRVHINRVNEDIRHVNAEIARMVHAKEQDIAAMTGRRITVSNFDPFAPLASYPEAR